VCDRNSEGQYPSCISALLDGPGAEDHGFCEPCAVEIRRYWKEMNLQIREMESWKEDLIGRLEHYTGSLWPDEVQRAANSLLQDFAKKRKCVAGCMDRHFCNAPKLHEGGCHCKLDG